MLDLSEVFEMSLSENDGKQELKEIIKSEDNNLYARTNLFLVVNGIFFAAIGISNALFFQVFVAIVGLIVGGLWFLCTYQSQRIIKALHEIFEEKYPYPDGDKYYWVIENELMKKKWLRPAELLGKILPGVFIVAWLICLIIFPVFAILF